MWGSRSILALYQDKFCEVLEASSPYIKINFVNELQKAISRNIQHFSYFTNFISVNFAFYKPFVSSSLITNSEVAFDGNILNGFINVPGGTYFIVDLGQVYSFTTIEIWLYHPCKSKTHIIIAFTNSACLFLYVLFLLYWPITFFYNVHPIESWVINGSWWNASMLCNEFWDCFDSGTFSKNHLRHDY